MGFIDSVNESQQLIWFSLTAQGDFIYSVFALRLKQAVCFSFFFEIINRKDETWIPSVSTAEIVFMSRMNRCLHDTQYTAHKSSVVHLVSSFHDIGCVLILDLGEYELWTKVRNERLHSWE